MRKIILLIFLLFSISENFAQCPLSVTCRDGTLAKWRYEMGREKAKIVNVIAGRKAELVCDAFNQYEPMDDCAGVKVDWYVVENEGGNVSVSPIVSYWSTLSGKQSSGPYMDSRYRARGNILEIHYAQPSYDDRTYYCEMHRTKPSTERAFSFVTLQIETCPHLAKGKYRGGPCHHGKCVMVTENIKDDNLNQTFVNIATLKCLCLPGYEKEFCQETRYWEWMWIFVSWGPLMVAAIGLVAGVIVYENGKTELIFVEAEIHSSHLRLGEPPRSSPVAPGSPKPDQSKRHVIVQK